MRREDPNSYKILKTMLCVLYLFCGNSPPWLYTLSDYVL
jgi:hypothetical protein